MRKEEDKMSTISSLFEAGLEEIRKSWGWFLVSGIVLIVLGAACIAKAQTATTFSILALGWILAISGVVWLVGALRPGPGEDFLCIC
jgi:uncharacterized membrane protein HdeD (DUF308 family)